MAQVELTVKKDYLPGWGLWEGIRELVQNGRDAEVEFNAPLAVEWRPSKVSAYGWRIHVENDGCVMPRKALLFGETSKEGRSDMIGHFGEGLKIGCLALVRDGRAVLIRTGSEVWRPSIRHSADFGEQVLAFQIQTGRKDQRRVEVEIEASREEWEKFKENFLFLWRETRDDRIIVPGKGALLTAPRFRGKVFVKGVFVADNAALNHGYDLHNAATDRDRKMVDWDDLASQTREVLVTATAMRPDLLDSFFRMLERAADDVRGIHAYNGWTVDEEVRKGVADKFTKRYGESAVPVSTIEESKDLEHLGKRGIVVPDAMRGVLSGIFGNIDDLRRKLRQEVKHTYSWSDLSEAEKAAFDRAVRLVHAARPAAGVQSKVDVVDFRDPNLLGQHKDGRYLIAKRALGRRALALQTLVHEVAHDLGADGDKGHVAEIEAIWSAVVEAVEVVEEQT